MQGQIDFRPASIARVIDLETTGRPEDRDPRICELGFVDVDLTKPDLPVSDGFTTLVDPAQPMPPEVSAIHHLIDEDLEGQPHVLDAWSHLIEGFGDDDVAVAHNYKFERAFLPLRQRWICTYRCAVRAWPDAVSHSNQGLRYLLGVQIDRERAQPPHRALPDAYVTAFVLKELLKLRPLERLIEVTAEPIIFKRLNFGKHKGSLCKDIPSDYWHWMINISDFEGDQLENAKFWFNKGTMK